MIEISKRTALICAVLWLLGFGYFVWGVVDHDRKTKYRIKVGSEHYDIQDLIEQRPGYLKAVKVGGEPIEVNGQYTLIGPYGDKR